MKPCFKVKPGSGANSQLDPCKVDVLVRLHTRHRKIPQKSCSRACAKGPTPTAVSTRCCPRQDKSQHANVKICGGDLPICVLGLVATGHNADLAFFRLDGEDNFCWQLNVILPLELSLLLEGQSCDSFRKCQVVYLLFSSQFHNHLIDVTAVSGPNHANEGSLRPILVDYSSNKSKTTCCL